MPTSPSAAFVPRVPLELLAALELLACLEPPALSSLCRTGTGTGARVATVMSLQRPSPAFHTNGCGTQGVEVAQMVLVDRQDASRWASLPITVQGALAGMHDACMARTASLGTAPAGRAGSPPAPAVPGCSQESGTSQSAPALGRAANQVALRIGSHARLRWRGSHCVRQPKGPCAAWESGPGDWNTSRRRRRKREQGQRKQPYALQVAITAPPPPAPVPAPCSASAPAAPSPPAPAAEGSLAARPLQQKPRRLEPPVPSPCLREAVAGAGAHGLPWRPRQ